MPTSRSYNLLCPISRALDQVGDRWTLLILRDLHAGPARFKDLQTGLKGIATNLLSDRLSQLAQNGLIKKSLAEHGTPVYALTPLGSATRDVLFELALLGGQFPAPNRPTRPGNLRTIAVSLEAALRRARPTDVNLRAEMRVDGEPFTLRLYDGDITVRAGADAEADVRFETQYEALLAVSEGDLPMADYAADHVVSVKGTPEDQTALFSALSRAITHLQGNL